MILTRRRRIITAAIGSTIFKIRPLSMVDSGFLAFADGSSLVISETTSVVILVSSFGFFEFFSIFVFFAVEEGVVVVMTFF